MYKRPQFLWRRRSLFVAVVLAVMIGSTISVLAATGTPSAKRYYACVAGSHKTLNLTSADATCPDGQRKISFGERGPRGATGAAGAKGVTGPRGATGAEGKVGATGPEGKAGPEGKQGPAGTGSGSPGPEGKEGPQGPVGPEGPAGQPGSDGEDGERGPPGIQGPAGPSGSLVYAASAGESVTLTTFAGGLPGIVALLPLNGDQAGQALPVEGMLDLSGGSEQFVPAQTFPIDQKIESMTVFSDLTVAQNLVGTTVTVTAQLYTSSIADNNTFTPVPGASVVATPPFTGINAIGTVSSGMTTGLSIPVTAGTRGVIVISAEATGFSLINIIEMQVGASISAAG